MFLFFKFFYVPLQHRYYLLPRERKKIVIVNFFYLEC